MDYKLHFEPKLFRQYDVAHGGLLPINDLPAHALFYYTLLAAKMYQEIVSPNAMRYEHDIHAQPNFATLFRTIALLYNIDPQDMGSRWFFVEQQYKLMGMNLAEDLPDKAQYRFRNVPVIIN